MQRTVVMNPNKFLGFIFVGCHSRTARKRAGAGLKPLVGRKKAVQADKADLADKADQPFPENLPNTWWLEVERTSNLFKKRQIL